MKKSFCLLCLMTTSLVPVRKGGVIGQATGEATSQPTGEETRHRKGKYLSVQWSMSKPCNK